MEAAAEGCGDGLQRRDKVKDSRALFQPLPLGEVSPKVTERARTLPDVNGLNLSVCFADSSPKGEAKSALDKGE